MNNETNMPQGEMPSFPMYPNPSNKNEENWQLMTVLHITWEIANKLADDERAFLLENAKKVNTFMQMQHEQQVMQQQMMQNQGMPPSDGEMELPDVVPNGPEMVLNANDPVPQRVDDEEVVV